MKKLFLTVVALVVAVGVFASGMFPDVPEKHWAYEYVKHLKDKGIVIGYPDGTFKGDRNITRYEEAAMISRLIGLIETEIVGPYIADVLKVLDAMSTRLGSTIERLGNLEKKVQELAGATRVEELAKAVETLKQTVNIHDKDVIKLYEALANLQKKHEHEANRLALSLEELTCQVQDLTQKHQALETALKTLEGNMSKLEKKLSNLEPLKNVAQDLSSIARIQSAKISNLETKVADLSNALNNAVKTINDLANRIAKVENDLSSGITKVEKDLAGLSGRVEKLERRVSENEKVFDKQAAKLGELALKIEEFEAFKATHDEQIDYILDELDSVNKQLSELRDGLFALREDVSGELGAMKSNVDAKFAKVEKTLEDAKAELLKKIEDLSKANAALTGAVIGAIIIAVAAMIVGAM